MKRAHPDLARHERSALWLLTDVADDLVGVLERGTRPLGAGLVPLAAALGLAGAGVAERVLDAEVGRGAGGADRLATHVARVVPAHRAGHHHACHDRAASLLRR